MGGFDFLKRFIGSGANTDGKINEAMPDEAMSDEDKCSAYRKKVASSGREFELEYMPENEAIMHILQEIGMKPEIANNADAVRIVSNIVKEIIGKEINGKLAVKSENLEKIKELLKLYQIVDSDGKVVNSDEGAILTKLTKKTVDVNKEGQCIYYTREKTQTSDRNGFTMSKDIALTITIEDGIEMSRYIEKDETLTRHLDMISKSEACTITRNADLVTAHVVMASGDFLKNKIEGQVMLNGRQINKLPREIEPEKFMDESPKNKKRNNAYIKEILKESLESSKEFENLAIKKGVVKGVGKYR